MKFFHLSDLHIGKQLYHYNMSEEQQDILNQIVSYAKKEQPDAVVIAGDIYDVSVPSAEAVSIFDQFLTSLTAIEPGIPVLLIAGNHDSATRLDFAKDILKRHQVHIAGKPPEDEREFLTRVTLSDAYGEVDFYLLPFIKPGYVRKLLGQEITTFDEAVHQILEREEIDATRRNVIVTHQFYTAAGVEPVFSDSEIHMVGGIENVDISALKAFDYAALGHIHRPQKVGKETIRYCGTPLPYSVSEAEDEKSITMVVLGDKGEPVQISQLPLTPLRRVRKLRGTLEELLNQSSEDYVSITLTDEIEAYHPRERLQEKFSHILEIKIDNARTRKLMEFTVEEPEITNPYEAFERFFQEMNGRVLSEEEQLMIREVINQEMEAEE